MLCLNWFRFIFDYKSCGIIFITLRNVFSESVTKSILYMKFDTICEENKEKSKYISLNDFYKITRKKIISHFILNIFIMSFSLSNKWWFMEPLDIFRRSEGTKTSLFAITHLQCQRGLFLGGEVIFRQQGILKL